MARELRAWAGVIVVVAAGCASSEGAPPPAGSSGASTSSSGGSSSSSGSTGAVPPIQTGAPPPPAACSGAPGELYAETPKSIALADIPMCRFKGDVLLIVNGASDCGYTPQYKPLQAIYEKYRAQGFYVLGFPSKSFNQERDTEKEVSEFCAQEYGIQFPLFQIGWVVDRPASGEPIQPVYKWIKAQPGMDEPVQWNFEKYLVDRKGKVVKRFLTGVEPDAQEVISAIEAELAKPR